MAVEYETDEDGNVTATFQALGCDLTDVIPYKANIATPENLEQLRFLVQQEFKAVERSFQSLLDALQCQDISLDMCCLPLCDIEPQDGDVLKWDAASGTWCPAEDLVGEGGETEDPDCCLEICGTYEEGSPDIEYECDAYENFLSTAGLDIQHWWKMNDGDNSMVDSGAKIRDYVGTLHATLWNQGPIYFDPDNSPGVLDNCAGHSGYMPSGPNRQTLDSPHDIYVPVVETPAVDQDGNPDPTYLVINALVRIDGGQVAAPLAISWNVNESWITFGTDATGLYFDVTIWKLSGGLTSYIHRIPWASVEDMVDSDSGWTMQMGLAVRTVCTDINNPYADPYVEGIIYMNWTVWDTFGGYGDTDYRGYLGRTTGATYQLALMNAQSANIQGEHFFTASSAPLDPDDLAELRQSLLQNYTTFETIPGVPGGIYPDDPTDGDILIYGGFNNCWELVQFDELMVRVIDDGSGTKTDRTWSSARIQQLLDGKTSAGEVDDQVNQGVTTATTTTVDGGSGELVAGPQSTVEGGDSTTDSTSYFNQLDGGGASG